MLRLPGVACVALVGLLSLVVCGCAHEAMRDARPLAGNLDGQQRLRPPITPHRPNGVPGEEADLKRGVEYALEYALDYGWACALADTLQSPLEDVQRNPLRCGLQAGFEDALEWSLRHVLDPDQKGAPQEVFQAARQQALAYARKEGVSKAVEEALQSVTADEALRSALKETLRKTLTACIEESLDLALDNALHGEPETLTAEAAFIWPINHPSAYITSTFGSQGKTRGGNGHPHAGVDIVVPWHTPVLAATDGTVTFAGESGSGYGRLVKIDHGDNVETWYAHLDTYAVQEGDRVTCGAQLGEVGQTGRATTPHLHYEVHQDGRPVDPRPYLP